MESTEMVLDGNLLDVYYAREKFYKGNLIDPPEGGEVTIIWVEDYLGTNLTEDYKNDERVIKKINNL